MHRSSILPFLLCFFVCGLNQSRAATTDEKMKEIQGMFESRYSEEDVYRVDQELLTATKHLMKVKEAPATATVITGEDIRRMGARNLVDVLARIPGIGITRGPFSLWEVEVRGLKTDRDEKIKLMVDGHSMNYPVWGGAGWAFDTLSLDQVERVEIIRGPGSALYGENAFSGVINVVTRKGQDLGGTEVSAAGGSFGTQRYSLAHGNRYGDLDIMAALTLYDTDGDSRHVQRDVIGRSGETDDWARSMDLLFNASWKDFTLNTRYLKRRNGPFVGVAYALNDESTIDTDQFFADLSFTKAVSDRWTVNAKTYVDYLDMSLDWEIFPEGYMHSLGAPGWGSKDSMIGNPSMKNSRYGTEVGADCEIMSNNRVTMGTVYEYVKHYDLKHFANFNPLNGEFLGSVKDITSFANWGRAAERNIWAAYVQDEWEIIRNVHLTAGARYDHYDDFGGVADPRAGLVWNFSPKAEVKVLYGWAFRAPTFEELYLINNPATLGNPDLEPEKMRTLEAAVGYRPFKGVELDLTGFYNEFDNRIVLVPTSTTGLSEFQNRGSATIYGVEAEAQYRWSAMRAYANFTWQHPEDDNGIRLPDVPSYRWNLGMDYGFGAHVLGNINVRYVGERPRVDQDPRSDLGSYVVADLNLIVRNLPVKNLEVFCSLFNLADADYAYPAPLDTLKDDFPAQGRTLLVGMRYFF